MPKIHTETKIKEKEQEKIFCVFFFFFTQIRLYCTVNLCFVPF